MNTIKLAIADDQILFLRGLKFIINTFEDVELIIEGGRAADCSGELGLGLRA